MPWTKGLIESLEQDKIPLESGRVISYVAAIREALALALARDPQVFVLGQGVDDPLAMFGTTKDLARDFGASRVFDTPLSEDGITGLCIGAAMEGMRPVYMHNRPDFLLLAFNQIVNHAAKIHYMDNGQTNVPLVVWSAIGRGWGSGPQHSQAIQGMLLGVPGLKIIMPSTPFDAKGLLLSAIQDNNPVFIFEHRWTMRQKGIVPEGIYTIPLGKGIRRRHGHDISIIGSSHILEIAMKALDNLPDISADVIDLRSIKPYDEELILDSVRHTGRALVLDTGWSMGGVCAEISCKIFEEAFSFLKAPVGRIGLPDIPTPAGYALEQYFYPDVPALTLAIKSLCGKNP